MTRKQFRYQQIADLKAAREAELKMLAQTCVAADPRYVQDVVEWIWNKVLDRKLRLTPETLDSIDRERRNTLIGLYA